MDNWIQWIGALVVKRRLHGPSSSTFTHSVTETSAPPSPPPPAHVPRLNIVDTGIGGGTPVVLPNLPGKRPAGSAPRQLRVSRSFRNHRGYRFSLQDAAYIDDDYPGFTFLFVDDGPDLPPGVIDNGDGTCVGLDGNLYDYNGYPVSAVPPTDTPMTTTDESVYSAPSSTLPDPAWMLAQDGDLNQQQATAVAVADPPYTPDAPAERYILFVDRTKVLPRRISYTPIDHYNVTCYDPPSFESIPDAQPDTPDYSSDN